MKKNQKNFLYFIIIVLSIHTIIVSKDSIELQLDKKPIDVSTYDWCTRKARIQVNIKTTALLLFLGIKTNLEIKKYKEYRKNINLSPRYIEPESSISKEIESCIYNVFNYDQVKRIINPIKISKEYNSKNKLKKIVIHTTDYGIIEVICSQDHDIINSTIIKNKHHTVSLNKKNIKNLNFSTQTIEALIGHELGHIIYDHMLEFYTIAKIYKNQTNTNNIDPNNPDLTLMKCKLYSKLRKAYEQEADIAGTFGNPEWIQGLIEFCNFLEPAPLYPTPEQRSAYMQKIYENMRK